MNSNANITSNSSFVLPDNVEMLWDVLKDSVIYEFMLKDERIQFRQHVIDNVRGFYNKEQMSNPSQSLMTMNKKFIEVMLNSLKQPASTQAVKRPPDLHTAKHIQDDRQQQFERKLTQKKEEFDSAINVKVPPAPNFSDKADTPISEMDSLIAQAVAQRNYEMEQIHKLNASKPASQQFLTAQDTSLKNEKQRDNDNALKQIKISKEDIGQKYVEPSVIHLKAPTQPLAKRIIINEELNETHYYNNVAVSSNNSGNSKYNNVVLPTINAADESVSLIDIFLKLKQIPAPLTVDQKFDAINKRLDDMQRAIDNLTR